MKTNVLQCGGRSTFCEDPELYPESEILDLLTDSPFWINSGLFQLSASHGGRSNLPLQAADSQR